MLFVSKTEETANTDVARRHPNGGIFPMRYDKNCTLETSKRKNRTKRHPDPDRTTI